jgi:hypothetical protein
MFTYTHTNIAIFRAVPTNMAGTVGAIFNGALQLGSAVGIAAVSSIETSVETKLQLPRTTGPDGGAVIGYQGRAAAFWFLLGVVGLESLNLLVFYRAEKGNKRDVESAGTEVLKKEDIVADEDAKVAPVLEKESESDGTRQEAEEVV